MAVLPCTAAAALVTALLLGGAAAFDAPRQSFVSSSDPIHKANAAFEDFKESYGPVYESVAKEAGARVAFEENMARISAHNSDPARSFDMGVNKFTDMSEAQFLAERLNAKLGDWRVNCSSASASVRFDADLDIEARHPELLAVNWTDRGAVTAIKDQGACGSCWAFSTTGALEAAMQIKYGHLKTLSEQQLVDCDRSLGDSGCSGGLPCLAFEYIIRNNGLDSEFRYPYTAENGDCAAGKAEHHQAPGTEISHWEQVTGKWPIPPEDHMKVDYRALLAAVNQQPVSIAIAADALMSYTGGIIDDGCDLGVDHAVLLVGYGVDEETGQEYWLVKNSWGHDWGESGFFRLLKRDETGVPVNTVCIFADSTIPVLGQGPPAPPALLQSDSVL